MEVQVITQHFRLKRLKEYLPTLTRSVKWHEDDVSIKADDLVLLQDDVKHEFWPSGRIEKVHCRQDGIVCVVDVCKKIGAYVRPAMKKKQKDVLLMRFLKVRGMLQKAPQIVGAEIESHLLVIPSEPIVMNTYIIILRKNNFNLGNQCCVYDTCVKFQIS